MKNKKKNNFKDLLIYKFSLFATKEFCIMSFFAIVCITSLISITCNASAQPNNLDNNINSVFISVITGYLVSYLVYIITIHIPYYTETIINDRIICAHLTSYKQTLIYSLGGLIYKLETEQSIEIPYISNLLNSKCKDKTNKIIIELTKHYNSTNELIENFTKLEKLFQELLYLNAMYKNSLSKSILHLQTSEWIDIIRLLKVSSQFPMDKCLSEICKITEKPVITLSACPEPTCSRNNFKTLYTERTKSLIKENFDLVDKAVNINKLTYSE